MGKNERNDCKNNRKKTCFLKKREREPVNVAIYLCGCVSPVCGCVSVCVPKYGSK